MSRSPGQTLSDRSLVSVVLAILIAGCTTGAGPAPTPEASGDATAPLLLEWLPAAGGAVAMYKTPWTLQEGRSRHVEALPDEMLDDIAVSWEQTPEEWVVVVYAETRSGLTFEGALSSASARHETATMVGNGTAWAVSVGHATSLLNRFAALRTSEGGLVAGAETWPRENVGQPLWLLVAARGGGNPTVQHGLIPSGQGPVVAEGTLAPSAQGRGFTLSSWGMQVVGMQYPSSQQQSVGAFSSTSTSPVHHPLGDATRHQALGISHDAATLGHFLMYRWNGAAVTTTERLEGQLVGQSVDFETTQRPAVDRDYYGDYSSHLRAIGPGTTDVVLEIERVGTTQFLLDAWWLFSVHARLDVGLPFTAELDRRVQP